LGAPARRIVVHYDRYDINRVYVRHPGSGVWLAVPRAGHNARTLGPCSEMWEQAVRRLGLGVIDGPLSEQEIQSRAAELRNLWSEEAMTDARVARLAAVERSRIGQIAHDLQDLSPEFARLAYGEGSEPLTPPVAAVTDDPFDVVDDEDWLDADEVDNEGLAL